MGKALREDNRRPNELRPVSIRRGFIPASDGSCLIELGGTRVICTASFSEGVKDWRKGNGMGWVTAEYGMLPASTGRRKARPTIKPDSRGVEIQRLIGRSLRNAVRFDRLGENTITIDCDVIQADGGTRTAAITGGYVALSLAAEKARKNGLCGRGVIKTAVAAVSVGIVDGRALLDLCYEEDAAAEVDFNVVMTGGGKFVEIQGSSEGKPFDRTQLDRMLRLAGGGIRKLLRCQSAAIGKGRKK